MHPLIAAGGFEDFIRPAIFIILALFWIVRQVWAGRKAQQQQPPVRRAPMPVPAQQQRPNDANVSAEIEEFLRRSSQRREAPKPQRAAASGPKPPRQNDKSRRKEPNRSKAFRDLSDRVETTAGERRPLGSAVGSASLAERQLQPKVTVNVRPEDKIGAHLSEVFNHEVGHLAKASLSDSTADPAEVERRPIDTVGLAAMLANREGMRTAVILNEILERPTHRW